MGGLDGRLILKFSSQNLPLILLARLPGMAFTPGPRIESNANQPRIRLWADQMVYETMTGQINTIE